MDGVETFREFVNAKTQGEGKKITVLALVGSGLSAASGIDTYGNSGDGANGMMTWRNYSAIDLATPDAFETNPALVWMFYAYRRHLGLQASPNAGHRVLAQLSSLDDRVNFLTITQNMDGLHQRAHHNAEKLLEFHGSLFEVRCTSFLCSYKSVTFEDPLTPALDASKYMNPSVPLPVIDDVSELPTCPFCKRNGDNTLLRPGVVWFGEALPLHLIDRADEFIVDHRIDVLLVIGTSHSVWPTSSYIDLVRNQGGRIAVFNTVKDTEIARMKPHTEVWQFVGDCSKTLPLVFDPILASWEK